jgi:predicted transcriptional regulator
MSVIELPVDEIIFRDDLYPRIEADTATIQRYAADLSVLPPIEVNQKNELIDGYHRWTAHRKEKALTIQAYVTNTASDIELLALATERNAAHGLQLSQADKKKTAVRLYAAGTGINKTEIARILSVSDRTISSYLSDIDAQLREERETTLRAMWLACYTQEEIAEAIGLDQSFVSKQTKELCQTENFPKSIKLSAEYGESDWMPPLYNHWRYGKLSNNTNHFGNTEQSIVDNLLYLYTQPFDIVVDPFAGGGSTIDVCKHRLRRYYVSDRLPIVERTDIRQYDILDGVLPLNNRWSDVSLVYLDPPYWRQAAGQYSNDENDLANMSLEDFYSVLVQFIEQCASRMKTGTHIALIIQPTQWLADNRLFPVDHVFDLVSLLSSCKNLAYKQRVICPYSTEQYNAQQVKWAKENKEVLTLNRELIIWEVVNG